ncbi:MAG: DUF4159 domain-containing protein [Planctomycetota bacterium]|jgi:hypothetical protein
MIRTPLSAILLVALLACPLPAAPQDDTPQPGLVHCANLIYGRNKSSVCFADHFLADIQKESNIRTASNFTPVQLESHELYEYPFSVMTGEGAFTLTEPQRENLRKYLTTGGFLLVSAGCSSPPWVQSFRREIKTVFPDEELIALETDHPIFHTVYDINELKTKSKSVKPVLEALVVDGRIVMVFSADGLNDTANAGGNCCCCGGNEVLDARKVNVNLLAYALTH